MVTVAITLCFWKKLIENTNKFVLNILPADVFAPQGARPSANIVFAMLRSRDLHLKGFDDVIII